jgi:toxin YhaV
VIVFAWVNDAETLRTYGSRNDAYAVFRAMLEDGNPPDSWGQLLDAASSDAVVRRLESLASVSSKLQNDME